MTPAKRRGLTVLASLTLATTALGASVAAQSPDAPQKGGKIIYGEWQTPAQLNPYLTVAVADFEAIYPITRGLTTLSDEGEYLPDLAVEVPSKDNGGLVADEDGDGFTMNVKLKPGLLWSDGTPFTTNDVKANYDWAVELLQSGAACAQCGNYVLLLDPTVGDPDDPKGTPDFVAKYGPDNQNIESITPSEDGLSATVKWKKNYAGWLGWLTTPLIAPQYWKDVPAAEADKRAVLGNADITKIPVNGPFVITGASADGIDYAPNPNWHATDPSPLDALKMQFYGSKDGLITAFLNGEVDLALNMTQADFPAIAGVDPTIGRALLDSVFQYELVAVQAQQAAKGLDDVNVRKAIALAIDKEEILKVLFPGADLKPACSIAPSSVWWHIDLPCVTPDPKAAGKLLEEAGWILGTDDLGRPGRYKDGKQLRLTMCTTSGNPTRLTTVGLISQQLSADDVAVPVDIVTVDGPSQMFLSGAPKDLPCNIYRGNYDIALFTSLVPGDPYSGYYFAYDSSQISTDSNPNGQNYSHLANKDMDAALADLGSKLDPADQQAPAEAVQKIVAEQFNELPLYNRAETTGVGVHLGGFNKYNPSIQTSLWNAEKFFYQP